MAKNESNIHKVDGAGWKPDSALGLAEDEAFRVTALLGVINKPALVGWAAKQETIAYEEAIKIAAENFDVTTPYERRAEAMLERVRHFRGEHRAHARARDQAADIGTQAHAWIEWYCRREMGQELREPEAIGPVEDLRDGWLAWVNQNDFRPLMVEQRVYSEADRWAGTIDIAGLVNGEPEVIDIKSSNGIWPEQLIQVSTYATETRHEAFGEKLPAARIIRLPKTAEAAEELREQTGYPFEERIVAPEEVIEYHMAFLAAKELFEQMRRLKRLTEQG